jgi:type III secretion system low calcium response chaperone LcrH/SycD
MLKDEVYNSNDAHAALYVVGYQLYENGKYREAVDVFRVLTVLDQTERKYWMGLGASLHMQKEYDRALQCYGYAALLNENDPYAHFHAAECFLVQGKREEAYHVLEVAKSVALHNKEKYNQLLEKIELIRDTWKVGDNKHAY